MSESATEDSRLDLFRRLTDLDAEVMIIKSVLEDVGEPMRIYPIVSDLEAEEFTRPRHRRIWAAVKAVASEGASPTFMEVLRYAKAQGPEALAGVGGLAGIASFGADAPTVRDPLPLLRSIREKAGLRLYWRKLKDVMTLVEEGESLERVREYAFRSVTEADSQTLDNGVLNQDDVTREAIADLEAEFAGTAVGITSGIEALDLRLRGGGFKRGQLVYVGARPSRGKTSLLLKMADAAAISGKRVMFFSLEMPGREIQGRRLLSEARVSMNSIRRERERRGDAFTGEAEWAAIARAAGSLRERQLILTDNDERTVAKMRSEAMREKMLRGLDMIVVDYLGYIEAKGRMSLYEKTTANSKGLHSIALALDVPVLAGVQLNRAPDGSTAGKDGERKTRRPSLADFRDSGAVEQDADIAILIHQEGEANAIKGGPVELILAKQRNGWTGTVDAQFIAEYATFADIPPDARAQQARQPFADGE